MFGILSYVIIKALSGKIREIDAMTWVVAVLFMIKVIIDFFG
jgi:AGZA family xanthine/uracil permease-like MFS transporter